MRTLVKGIFVACILSISSIGAYAETAKVVVIPMMGDTAAASVSRNISFITGESPDDRDDGLVTGRGLTFNKLSSTSDVRISYTDNFRVLASSSAAACSWEVLINGLSCPSQKLVYTKFEPPSSGFPHASSTVVGYCKSLSAGDNDIEVFVSSTPGYNNSDCYTGWESTYMLEVEEIND